MGSRAGSPAGLQGRGEFCLVILCFAVLTCGLTYPLVFDLGGIGYNLGVPGDPQFSVWNVTWVARTIVLDPLHVFDANIFFPFRGTLAYSEANLGAGLLGVPGYWLTRDAFVTHNSALLLALLLNGVSAYSLARYLTRDRAAAAVAGISFAYCPYAFGHLAHIQLLMTSGLPLSLLAFHRLCDEPSPRRGLLLGAALIWQALGCGYYAVFIALAMALFVVLVTLVEHRWKDWAFWKAITIATSVSAAATGALYLPYSRLQNESAFSRPLAEAATYSANWPSYLTSSATLSSWIHPLLPQWSDVLFPGFIAIIFGFAGLTLAWRAAGRPRTIAVLYGSLAILAFWLSFGPRAGLYSGLYALVPALSFLRAPSRFGILVVLALSILASLHLSRLLAGHVRRRALGAAIVTLAIALRVTPIPWSRNPTFSPAYVVLAEAPPGAVLELPVYSRPARFNRTRYMLASTVHWKPLVNAYSDFTPDEFSAKRDALSRFPTMESLGLLNADAVRYVLFHLSEYDQDPDLRLDLEHKMAALAPHLEPLYRDSRVWLYRIIGSIDE